MKFEVRNRWTGNVKFTAEIECDENTPHSVRVGLAVRWAIKNSANLTGTNLSRADLSGANLSRTDLSRTDLTGTNLSRADLSRTDLSGADLSGADLSGADLSGANLTGAKNADLVIAQTRILPEGDLIGWKKLSSEAIAKLLIPADAPRSHAFGRKCRAKYADVLEIHGLPEGETVGRSTHNPRFTYTAGQRVECDEWCEDWQQECAGGIHFFITREEAEDY